MMQVIPAAEELLRQAKEKKEAAERLELEAVDQLASVDEHTTIERVDELMIRANKAIANRVQEQLRYANVRTILGLHWDDKAEGK